MRVRGVVYASPTLLFVRNELIELRKLIARVRVGSWRFAAFGKRSVIWPPLRVAAFDRIAIGDHVSIGSGAWLSINASATNREGDPMLLIGSNANFGDSVSIVCSERVEIGPNVLAASRVFIADSYHHYLDATRPVLEHPMAPPKPVMIQEGAFLGVNVIILPGVTIGEGAYVGAGSVVTRDVPPRSVVVGNPARVIKRWHEASGGWVDVPSGEEELGP